GGGDVLGTDRRWVWPEFAPRRDAAGALLETGDDRVVGRRAGAGGLPGALWGERPGAAWYALETLARLREADASAALVPLDVPARGQESERAGVAIGLADVLGQPELAEAIESAFPAPAADLARLRSRLARTAARGRPDEAATGLRHAGAAPPPRLAEPAVRALGRIAADLRL